MSGEPKGESLLDPISVTRRLEHYSQAPSRVESNGIGKELKGDSRELRCTSPAANQPQKLNSYNDTSTNQRNGEGRKEEIYDTHTEAKADTFTAEAESERERKQGIVV